MQLSSMLVVVCRHDRQVLWALLHAEVRLVACCRELPDRCQPHLRRNWRIWSAGCLKEVRSGAQCISPGFVQSVLLVLLFAEGTSIFHLSPV